MPTRARERAEDEGAEASAKRYKTDEEAVTVDAVMQTLQANVKKAQQVIKAVLPKIAAHTGPHPQKGAMNAAIMTNPNVIPDDEAFKLAPIIGDYRRIPKPEVPAVGFGIWAVTTWLMGYLQW